MISPRDLMKTTGSLGKVLGQIFELLEIQVKLQTEMANDLKEIKEALQKKEPDKPDEPKVIDEDESDT